MFSVFYVFESYKGIVWLGLGFRVNVAFTADAVLQLHIASY